MYILYWQEVTTSCFLPTLSYNATKSTLLCERRGCDLYAEFTLLSENCIKRTLSSFFFFNLFGIKVRATRMHVSILMVLRVSVYFFCDANLGLFAVNPRA